MHASVRSYPALNTPPLRPAGRSQQAARSRHCLAGPQVGTGLIEFAIAAIPILLLGLGSIELARWMLVRQGISLALLQAARAASTDHARPETLEHAFETALLPLFPGGGKPQRWQALQTAFAERKRRTGNPPWQMEILAPGPLSFQDHADGSAYVAGADGLAVINNDYQFEQDQRLRARGWTEGRGPISGLSIFQANTLVLRLRYLHEPIVPGIQGLLAALGNPHGTYSQQAMAQGYLPIMQEIAHGMHSHPVDWPMPPNKKVIGAQPAFNAPASSAPTCAGLWCTPGYGVLPPANPATDHTPAAESLPASPDGPAPPERPRAPVTPNPDTHTPDTLTVDPDDPSCGITLCCSGA